jgi:hypothetical protein
VSVVARTISKLRVHSALEHFSAEVAPRRVDLSDESDNRAGFAQPRDGPPHMAIVPAPITRVDAMDRMNAAVRSKRLRKETVLTIFDLTSC